MIGYLRLAPLSLLLLFNQAHAQQGVSRQCAQASAIQGKQKCTATANVTVYKEGSFKNELCTLLAKDEATPLLKHTKANWYLIVFSDNTYGYIPRQIPAGAMTLAGKCLQ